MGESLNEEEVNEGVWKIETKLIRLTNTICRKCLESIKKTLPGHYERNFDDTVFFFFHEIKWISKQRNQKTKSVIMILIELLKAFLSGR